MWKRIAGLSLALALVPTGAHKVGPADSCLIEKQVAGELQPGRDRLVFPSTGNYGIGGSWVGPRMNYESLVVLPAEMSAERFEKIESYGAQVIKTPGSESNVKEIYDKVNELKGLWDRWNQTLVEPLWRQESSAPRF